MSDRRSVYNELRLERHFCDAVIRVDSVEFHVHKVIMCNCSPYFRALFTHWSIPECQVFDISSVSPDIMRLIIEYAYTGFVPVSGNVKELFVAADHFSVAGIVQVCTELLEKQMDPQNCLGIWKFTEIYYYPELNRKALLFTLHHFEEIVANSEEFLLLSVQELVTIIENDQLNVKQEKTVYEAVIRWIVFAPEQRKEYAALLLFNIRLALMSTEYITEKVITNEVVQACQDCQMVIVKALEAMVDLQTMGISGSVFGNPLARPRLPSAVLLAVGGWGDGTSTNSIEAYDVNAESWVSVANNGIPRAYHGVAFLHGSLYYVGGFDGEEYFSTVHRFDLSTHIWHELGPMHFRRCYVSVTVMDGCIYAIGGSDGHNRLKTAERYDPGTNQWTLIAPMHEERSDANCTVLQEKLYICGGFNGAECLFTAECYDPKTNHWTLITPMDERRSGVGVITYADHIFAVGGYNGTTRLRSVEAYNPYTNTWQALPSMLGPRSNFGLSVIDDRLYAVGGFNGISTTNNVECFDANTGAWSAVCNMGMPRSALSCCVVSGLDNMVNYTAPRFSAQFSSEEELES
ncbi:kelch-like protein 10 [Mugil cephalus]|uniref:kelch-like protein 10 n=1 Tax=Mugil cephalus TaxID=48193 RepID=UPI001FB7155B|nr:kelch-like protein 10 [Mugil cephalus]